jgi:hypothetical protein
MSRRMSLPATPINGANHYSEFHQETEVKGNEVKQQNQNQDLKTIFDRSRRSSLFPVQESKFRKVFWGFRVPKTPGRHFLAAIKSSTHKKKFQSFCMFNLLWFIVSFFLNSCFVFRFRYVHVNSSIYLA